MAPSTTAVALTVAAPTTAQIEKLKQFMHTRDIELSHQQAKLRRENARLECQRKMLQGALTEKHWDVPRLQGLFKYAKDVHTANSRSAEIQILAAKFSGIIKAKKGTARGAVRRQGAAKV